MSGGTPGGGRRGLLTAGGRGGLLMDGGSVRRGRLRVRSAAVLMLISLLSVSWVAARPFTDRIKRDQLPDWVRDAADRAAADGGAGGEQGDLVWLYQETLVEPLAGGGVRLGIRQAGKINGRPGLSRLDSYAIAYSRGDDVQSLRAWTLLPDGMIVRTDSKEHISDYPAIEESEVFSDNRIRVIKAQGASVGSIVAYESVVVRRQDPGSASWIFGDSEHFTAVSRFELRVPEGWGWRSAPLRTDSIESQESERGVVLTGKNLAPLPREELRPPVSELLPGVRVGWWGADGARGYRTWDDVGTWLYKLYEPVLRNTGESGALAANLTPATPEATLDAIARAFEFVSRQVRYVAIEVGVGGYVPHAPAEAFDNRYGDCKDKSFLMRAIVEKWGLRTYPVLVRTRALGPLVEEVPSPGQFNHMIVAVALPEGAGRDLWSAIDVEGLGRLVFLDATVREGSPWDLRTDVQGTTALLVHPDGGRLITLPWQPPDAGDIARDVELQVDEQGAITEGVLRETWRGSEATWIREIYAGKTEEKTRLEVEEAMQARFPGMRLLELSFAGLERVDGPVVRTAKLSGSRFGKRAGRMLILEPGSVGGDLLGVNLPPPPRRWPLRVGTPRRETLHIGIRPPEGWQPDEIPAAMSQDSAVLHASCSWNYSDGVLVYEREATLLAPEIAPEDYERFRSDIRSLQRADATGLILVRR